MNSPTALTSVVLILAASVARGQVYNNAPLVVPVPATLGTPTKVCAANFTPDGIADLITLQSGTLYVVHGPSAFARWEPIAANVFDFAVVRDALTLPTQDLVFFTTNSGLSVAWSVGGQATTQSIASTGSWLKATKLCGVSTHEGLTQLAGVGSNPKSVLRGTRATNGTWTNLAPIGRAAAITSLAIADFDAQPAATGVEIATVSAGKLDVLNDFTGVSYSYTGQIALLPGQAVYRNPNGGAVGDSLVYVCTAPAGSGSAQFVYELFSDGASNPIGSGSWTVGSAAAGRGWHTPTSSVVISGAGTPDVFRLHDFGSGAGQTTLGFLLGEDLDENYWQVHALTQTLPETAITDGLLAFGDFDSEGNDDILLSSAANRALFLYRSYDSPYGGSVGLKLDQTAQTSPGVDSVVTLQFTATINAIPRNFPANTWPDRFETAVWVRNGYGTSNYINLPLVAYALAPVVMNGNLHQANVAVQVDLGSIPISNALLYVQAADVLSGPNFQRGNIVATVTVADVTNQAQHDLLCSMLRAEPDAYSENNRANLGCTNSPHRPAGDPVILSGGFQRRSSIGPFQPGTGSPLGSH